MKNYIAWIVAVLFSINATSQTTSNCLPPTATTFLEINNVRALITSGGDMWWDLQGTANYEVPKGSGKNALFAGSIWIGGIDQNNQLRIAGQRFRQDGYDFWTGPIKTTDANTNKENCHEYDKFFTVYRKDVEIFKQWYNASEYVKMTQYQNYEIPESIIEWPAHGDIANNYSQFLAPFYDNNNDDVYNPNDGDYPFFDLDETECGNDNILYGDVAIWHVFNDMGNVHTETDGNPLGIEFQAHAFAYSSIDEDINNTTFYNYQIINRSANTLSNTYIGMWTDADLGYNTDDYLGCDVNRGLGYLFNGYSSDGYGEINSYGFFPPAVGIDFIRGPLKDPNQIDDLSSWDTNGNLDCEGGYRIDSLTGEKIYVSAGDITNGSVNGQYFGDGITDNERLGMTSFIYFSCGGCGPFGTSSPHNDIQHYNILKGNWITGEELLYGGNGYNTQWDGDIVTSFMFPSNSDPCGYGQNGTVMSAWDEYVEDNQANDRRFIQSSGPITIEPGEINNTTVAVIWARETQFSESWHSVPELKNADDKIQALFDNCFRVLEFPDAPELNLEANDQSISFTIWNRNASNNYMESYNQTDNLINCEGCDKTYKFQGYQVYQLVNKNVTIEEINDISKARLVYQTDIHDDIHEIINYEKLYDSTFSYIPNMRAIDKNEGIVKNFTLNTNAFSDNNAPLENHQTYYYMAIAYAYNNFKTFDLSDSTTYDGQRHSFLQSMFNTKVYEISPVPVGVSNNLLYHKEPAITQYDGFGCGYNFLDLTQESIDKIMSSPTWRADTLKYIPGRGPVNIKIIDPLNYIESEFILKLIPDSVRLEQDYFYYNSYWIQDSLNYDVFGYIFDSKWMIIDINNAVNEFDTLISSNWISENKLQVIPELGIAIDFNQTPYALAPQSWPKQPKASMYEPQNNGFISASIEFENPNEPWLKFLPDGEYHDFQDWIKAGVENYDGNVGFSDNCARLHNDRNVYAPYYPVPDGITPIDKNEIYENILSGTWAPYRLGNTYLHGITNSVNINQILSREKKISNVDIVITSDQSKWTRCPVVETTDNDTVMEVQSIGLTCVELDPDENSYSEGNALKFNLRNANSVGKDGLPDNSGTTGMSWFPGYAIDVETGERLNMIFGESSKLLGENGRDMRWNPTERITTDLYNSSDGLAGEVLMGGKHFIYVLGHNTRSKSNNIITDMPAYDEGEWARRMFTNDSATYVFMNAMWTAIPLIDTNYDFLSSDVKIKLRAVSPYRKKMGSQAYYPDSLAPNKNFPMYSFNTQDLNLSFEELSENKNPDKNTLVIYPNPNNGNFTIALDTLKSSHSTYKIYSIDGKLITSGKLYSKLKNIQLRTKGIYLVQVNDGEKVFSAKVLVK